MPVKTRSGCSARAAEVDALIGKVWAQCIPNEYVTFEREDRVLSQLRFGLHLASGKAEERLRFDYQEV